MAHTRTSARPSRKILLQCPWTFMYSYSWLASLLLQNGVLRTPYSFQTCPQLLLSLATSVSATRASKAPPVTAADGNMKPSRAPSPGIRTPSTPLSMPSATPQCIGDTDETIDLRQGRPRRPQGRAPDRPPASPSCSVHVGHFDQHRGWLVDETMLRSAGHILRTTYWYEVGLVVLHRTRSSPLTPCVS